MKKILFVKFDIQRERENPCSCIPSKHGGEDSGTYCNECGNYIYDYGKRINYE